MRILLVATAFNSLTQRLWVELAERGHDISLEFDVNDAVVSEAVRMFRPDLVVAPYLRRALPEGVYRAARTLVVHPGPVGDRGPAALDWAILENHARWGVTVLEATEVLDGGDVWAHRDFVLRAAPKSSLYRDEVTEGAVAGAIEAIAKIAAGATRGTPLAQLSPDGGAWRPKVPAEARRIDWTADSAAVALRKIRSADGQPGIEDEVLGLACKLHDAWPEATLSGRPGEVIARRDHAICRATADGAVWIGHLKVAPRGEGERAFKVPAATALGGRLAGVPEAPLPLSDDGGPPTFREIAYAEDGPVGRLAFRFTNGAMSVDQCRRLLAALQFALARPTRVLVLAGGREFWSNGMHLSAIEAAASPSDESWANINAIDDVARALIAATGKVTIAAIEGNIGAGGVFLALACDHVWVRDGVVLNPHYKNMGNLYGSEYWTYVLPRRVGRERVEAVMGTRLPVGAAGARRLGLADAALPNARAAFRVAVAAMAREVATEPAFVSAISAKMATRSADEAEKSLESYRADELERMRLNFYGFDSSYHVARWRFVTKELHARTPHHLARHRAAKGPLTKRERA